MSGNRRRARVDDVHRAAPMSHQPRSHRERHPGDHAVGEEQHRPDPIPQDRGLAQEPHRQAAASRVCGQVRGRGRGRTGAAAAQQAGGDAGQSTRLQACGAMHLQTGCQRRHERGVANREGRVAGSDHHRLPAPARQVRDVLQRPLHAHAADRWEEVGDDQDAPAHLWLSCLRAGPPAAARRQTASASETPPHARHQNADLFATGDDQRQDRPVREATGDEQKYRSRDRV